MKFDMFLPLIVLGSSCGVRRVEVFAVREWKGGLALETVFVYGNLAFMNG